MGVDSSSSGRDGSWAATMQGGRATSKLTMAEPVAGTSTRITEAIAVRLQPDSVDHQT